MREVSDSLGRRDDPVWAAPTAVTPAPLTLVRPARLVPTLRDAPVHADIHIAAREERGEPPVQPLTQRTGDEQHIAPGFRHVTRHAVNVPAE